jgi:hypothetical protein
MTQNPGIEVRTLTGIDPVIAARAIRRHQQRQQTLEWIATNAFLTLRSAWSGAKLGGNDYAHGSGSSGE